MVLCAGFVAGCAASSSHAPGPGTTVLYVASRGPAACSLQRLSLTIDGGVKYAAGPSDVAELDASAREVARVGLPAGTHSLGVFASTACTSAELGDEPVVLTSRDGRLFLVGEGPAAVVVDLSVGKASGGSFGEARLDVVMRIRGGELGPTLGIDGRVEFVGAVDGAGLDVRHCTGLEPSPKAICRAEAIVAQATAQRDVVRVLCTKEKLAQMRMYATIIERARQRSAGAARADERAEDARIIEGAEERVRSLSGEIDRCAGEEVTKSGSDP